MKREPRRHKCQQMQLLLDEFSHGELDAVEANTVEAHLANCEECRSEYSAFTISRGALSNYPHIRASADFDMRVLDQILQQNKVTNSVLDRLDAIFARPLYKLMGSAMLSVLLGLLTIVIIVGPKTFLEKVVPLSSNTGTTTQQLTAANPEELLGQFFASGHVYPEFWREESSLPLIPDYPVAPKGGVPAWKPSKESSPDASDFSYSVPSGSSC